MVCTCYKLCIKKSFVEINGRGFGDMVKLIGAPHPHVLPVAGLGNHFAYIQEDTIMSPSTAEKKNQEKLCTVVVVDAIAYSVVSMQRLSIHP